MMTLLDFKETLSASNERLDGNALRAASKLLGVSALHWCYF